MVPVGGLEPPRCHHHRILNPTCLPISSHWHVKNGANYRESKTLSQTIIRTLFTYSSNLFDS